MWFVELKSKRIMSPIEAVIWLAPYARVPLIPTVTVWITGVEVEAALEVLDATGGGVGVPFDEDFLVE